MLARIILAPSTATVMTSCLLLCERAQGPGTLGYDLSAQPGVSVASPDCLRQVIPHPGKNENGIAWLTQPGRHLGCLHQNVQRH